jgi:hypothetical protein
VTAPEHVARTHEPELTEPVDLATPDGHRLNPAARGWSRRPLHRANLRGRWGRTKRWDYWAILAGDHVISSVYADVDYIGLADVWWVDLATGTTGGRGLVVPGAAGISLPDEPGTAPLRVRKRALDLEITDAHDGATTLRATWRERDGTPGRLDATVALPPGHESLNVVIPWDEQRFQFTSKHTARPAHGELVVGDRRVVFGADAGVDAWGVLDVGRGRWPYETRWNWGSGAGRAGPDGPVIGLQIGGKWTEGTGFTENGVLVDGRLTKLGRELRWTYSWDDPMAPWRVHDPSGRLDLELTPRFDKHSKTDAVVLRTETHQVFGTWSGRFVSDSGDEVTFSGLQGFAEESRSRW